MKEQTSTPWEPITAFDEYQLPSFPVYTLSPDIQEWVRAESENTQTPADLSALVALGVVATTVQRKVEIVLRPGWSETLSAYILVLLGPGNRKSAVFSHGTAPIYEYEKALRKNMKEEVERSQSEYRIMQKRVKRAEDDAAKADPDEFEEKKQIASDLAHELSKIKPLVYPRFIVDDVTPEKIVSLLLEQNERIGLLSADTDAFSIIGGRYDKQGKPNLGVFLKAHVGDTHVVDRMSRQGGILHRPAITLALTIQPIVLQEMGSVSQFTERGLTARMWFALPVSTVGHRQAKADPVPQLVAENYKRLILNLLHLKDDEDEYGKPRAWSLRLSDEANEVFNYYASTIEPRLAPHGNYHNFTNWASKLVGSVARIAGLLHLADHHGHPAPWDELVSPDTIFRAIEIGDYLAEHARAAHGLMKTDPEVENAKYLLSWIAKIGKPVFTKRNLHRHVRGKLQKIDDLETPLNLLIKHGYLREKETDRKPRPGRNPSLLLETHPDFLKSYGHNGHNSAIQENSDHSDHNNTKNLDSKLTEERGEGKRFR